MSHNPQTIGDEMLTRIMQFCDGTLDPKEAEIVAREIAADPTLQALADDLTLGASAARDALMPLANQPVPLALARTIVNARSTHPRPSLQGSFGAMLRGRAAAALIGLAVGAALIGLWLSSDQQEGLRLAGATSQEDNAASSDEFRAALLSALSAQPALVKRAYPLPDMAAGQGSVSVIRWFKLASGMSCAEFTQEQPAVSNASGIACRRADGGWEVISLTAPAQ